MLWTISESVAMNIGFWCGIWGIGGCLVLFILEKMIKDLNVSGRVYGGIILLTISAAVVSILWSGRAVEAGRTKAYDPPKKIELMSPEEVSAKNIAAQEKIDKKYNDYSEAKDKELRQESDSFFDQLMEQENKQRKADKNKKQQ